MPIDLDSAGDKGRFASGRYQQLRLDALQDKPRPSYRPSQGGKGGDDPDLRRVAIAATAVGGALALIMVGFVLVRPNATIMTVPIVDAPAGPVRVKPLSSGGMQVMGADEPTDGKESLSPQSERPQIAALRAKAKPRPTPALTQTVAAANPVVAPPATLQRASAMMTIPARTPPAMDGSAVQLAAFETAPAAQAQWATLSRTMPDVFTGHQPELIHANVAGHPVWRLRTAGFATVADAVGFCTRVRSHGGDCSIAAF